MSTDRDYKVRVSIASDNAGAESAKDSLKQVGTASEETGKQGEKSAEGMFEKHHELHKLIHAIGNDAVPGMGHAFAALAMGPLGALTAIALVVEMVKKNIENTSKKLDELAAESAKAFGGGNAVTEYVNATAQAATQTEEFAAAMHKAASAGDVVKNRYDAEAKAIQAAVEALKEKLKTQEEADLVDARNAGKRGVSPEVVAAMEADIHARYESRSQAVQDASSQALRTAMQRELYERQQNDPALTQAAKATETPVNATVTRKQRTDELAAQEQALAKATADLNTAENEKLHDVIEGAKKDLENMHRTGVRGSIIKNREAELSRMESETAESRKAEAEDRIKQLSKQVAKDTENAAKEKEAREQATNAATENTKRIVELQKQIADANPAAKIKTESIAELVRNVAGYDNPKVFEKAAGVDTNAGAAALIQKFLASQSRLSHHQGNGDDSQMVKLLNLLLQTTQQSDSRMYLLLQDLIRHKGDLDAALADLAKQTARPRQ